MTDYTELKRLAEAAVINNPPSKWYTTGALYSKAIDWRPDALFIAAASPDVTLQMIAEIDKLRTQNQALVKEMRHIAGISNGQVKHWRLKQTKPKKKVN